MLQFHGVSDKHQALWLCRCDCGKETTVRGSDLRSGGRKSCGCLLLESRRFRRARTHGEARDKKESREYIIWCGMKQRCQSPNSPRFADYGGRGITVCDEWRESFPNFLRDMGRSNGLSLDRIDNDKGYSPENCRWATTKQQNNNRRQHRMIECFGVRKSLTEWSEYVGLKFDTIFMRLKRGWSVDDALMTPQLR